MSNINQINSKILTSSQFNPAALPSKMQEFIRVESQVRSEIDSIQQKKDRFREWTKSLGESPKIQEMFTKFDLRIQALFQKLDQFVRLREELATGYLSDTVYTPLAGDVIVKLPTDDFKKSQVELIAPSTMLSGPEEKKVSALISETETFAAEIIETESQPISEEQTIESETEPALPTIAVFSTEEPGVESCVGSKGEDEKKIIVEAAAAPVLVPEPELPSHAMPLEAAVIPENIEPVIPVDEKISSEANQYAKPIESGVSDANDMVELPVESSVELTATLVEPLRDEVLPEEQPITVENADIVENLDVQPIQDIQVVEPASETIVPETTETNAAEAIEQIAEVTEAPLAEPIQEHELIEEPLPKTVSLESIENQTVLPAGEIEIIEPVSLAPISVAADDVEIIEDASQVEVIEATDEKEVLFEIEKPSIADEPVVPVTIESAVTIQTEEPVALLSFEINETTPIRTEQPELTEEKTDQQQIEINFETQEPSELIEPEIAADKTTEIALEPEGEAVDFAPVEMSEETGTRSIELTPDVEVLATIETTEETATAIAGEDEVQSVEPDSVLESDLSVVKTDMRSLEDEPESILSAEEKMVMDSEIDTETLTFEINENILAEAIRNGFDEYESEPIEDESAFPISTIPELVAESQPLTTLAMTPDEDDEKSVDMLEMTLDVISENEGTSTVADEESAATEFLQIEIAPDAEMEETEVLQADAISAPGFPPPVVDTIDLIDITEISEENEELVDSQKESAEPVDYLFGSQDIRRPRPVDLTEEEKQIKERIPKLPKEIFEKKFPRGRVDLPGEPEEKQSSSEANQPPENEVTEGTFKEKLFNVKKIKSRFSLRKLMKTKEDEETMEMERERDVKQPEIPVTDYEPEDNQRVEVKPEVSRPVQLDDKNVLYLGIDLGTSETTVAASNGVVETILSVIGKPKDVISQKLLKKEILFGMEALRNRLALTIYRPLEKGVIKDTDADLEAARELVKYVINLADTDKYDKVYAVIGAPARSSFANQQALMDAAREVVDAVMIVSEPFAVAYGEGKIYNSLIIDIGAGTTDICSLKGSMPGDEDQFTLLKAGDYIDNHLMDGIKNRIQGAQITKELCKKWKEESSFVIEPDKAAVAQINIEGKPAKVDITKDIQASCESILPDIVTCINSIVSNFDPEFQDELKQNIMLAGGGSLIKNIDQYLERALRALGSVKVTRVVNPIEAGARGALSLAKDLTDDYWRAL